MDLLHLIESTFDWKRIYANPNSYTNPNSSPIPKAQLCFRTDEMTLFFDQVYRYRWKQIGAGRFFNENKHF